jgi:SOS response regulatory protein OraA/RecX
MPHAMNHHEKAKISQELVTMGFGIDLAQKAVENMHGRSLEAALDWLTESAPQAPIAG